ncbi:hypothetical protein BUALT_Bualt01G0086000 [Buddleja alternifolia]|uniref:Caffeic acid O-methyltransferase n=1 Tax=Buddleja alternifolia TaxID=168488 RepID=A0AAV6Y6H4_9LAMI|nr:hypothetical protein BUALT_Bualt01G0086000 [Buddleja alternifolia]
MGSSTSEIFFSSSMDSSDEGTGLFAMELATVAVLPAVLKSAIELDLLEFIKKARNGDGATPVELAGQLQATNPEAHIMIDRILRLLASYNILSCTAENLPDGGVERRYSLAPVCKFFTKNDDGVSFAPLLLLREDKIMKETWHYLKDAVLEGGTPFNRAHGMSAFEYPAIDPRFNKVFNQAMSQNSTIVMKKILENYEGFEGLRTLVDVGGGIGATLKMITSKYPSIKGINFDLPHVIRDAPSYPGVEHIDGDMFVSVPKGEAIFMKWICHDWSDEHCLKILKNCYEALPTYGKVIIAECILPEVPNKTLTSFGFNGDMIMLANFIGGKERTEKEFQILAKNAGFKEFRKVCCAHIVWIMEFHK